MIVLSFQPPITAQTFCFSCFRFNWALTLTSFASDLVKLGFFPFLVTFTHPSSSGLPSCNFSSRCFCLKIKIKKKASFLRQPWSHDRSKFNPHPDHVLCPWIRRFMMIITAWWLWTSSNFSEWKLEEIHRNIGSLETSKQVRIPPTTKIVIAMKNVRIVQ